MNRKLTLEQLVMRRNLSRYLEKRKRLYEKEKRQFVPLLMYYRSRIIDEERLEVIEENCIIFGCPKTLTPLEKLYGDTCTEHMGFKKEKYHHGKL